MFLQHLVNALSIGSVYALIAIGYNMVYGILEKLNFAHGDVFAVGVFVTWTIIGVGGNVFLGILAGCLIGYILNIIVERFAYRPLRNSGRIAPTISAVGIAYIMRNAIQLIWGAEARNFDLGIFDKGQFFVGDIVIGKLQIYIFLIAIILVAIITLLLKYTKWGQAIIAISQNIPTSQILGVPVNRVVSIVYGLGAVLGVIGGLLYCQYYNFIYMGIGFINGTMKAWMASIWGGIGSLQGAVIGAIMLGLTETFVSAYVSSAYRDAFVWGVFIIFILIRPRGMYPAAISEKI